MKTTEERVRDIIVEQKNLLSPSLVKPETKFFEDLGFDSLDNIEVVMAVEDEFGIEIVDEDAEKLTNVEKLVAYIDGKKK